MTHTKQVWRVKVAALTIVSSSSSTDQHRKV
jgi:hypothetical protein